jgi:hypothetical protein
MVTHDEPLAYRHADQIFRCYKGELILEEPPRPRPTGAPASTALAAVS